MATKKTPQLETVVLLDDSFKTRTIVDDGNALAIKWGQIKVTFDPAYIDTLCAKYGLRRHEASDQKEAK